MKMRPIALAMALTTIPGLARAEPQSDRLSQVSALSVEPSVAVAALALHGLESGSRLLVTAVEVGAGSVLLGLRVVATGAEFLLRIAAGSAVVAGLAIGTVVLVTASGAGYLLSVGGEALAFVADASVAPHIHHRRL
jgi:hypothetical protein